MTTRTTQNTHARPAWPPRLGIIGGGQLAKMTAAAATQLGCEVVIFERKPEFPADSVDTQSLIGDWDDPADLARLADVSDRITLENEFVNPDALAALEARGVPVTPSVATMRRVQDKFVQKQTLQAAGLAVVEFADAPRIDDVRAFGAPAVLKKRHHSYDGKGNADVGSAGDIERAWQQLDGDRNPLYIERRCAFTRELAAIVTRSTDGRTARYPVVETINRNHICHTVVCPADVPAPIADAAAAAAERAIEAISGVGSFGIELFLDSDGRVLVNEIAPRVHNTGHYTIEACACSQFENHVRAVFGWPLGSPRPVVPAAVMVNLLGAGEGDGTPHGLERALEVEGAAVHVYGKLRSSRGRKMGHVTAVGPDRATALVQAERAASHIRFGD